MAYEVVPGNITWVCENVLKSVNDGQFNHGEVILGVAEALGRIVIASAETPVQGASALQACIDHLRTTLAAGYSARGYDTRRH